MLAMWLIHIQCDQMGRFIDFGQILKPMARINLPKSPTVLGKVSKSIIFLVKSFL